MGFWGLMEVASMAIMQVLIVSGVGAFMAIQSFHLLSSHTRNSLNKIVFVAFTPSLIFASLVKTVTFEDIISWWFMPINIGITFLCGGILGWAAVQIIKPKPHLEGLIIAMCSTGNFANLLLIMVPAICTDDSSPFGDHGVCKTKGLSYASFSMALGSFFTWTCTFQLIQNSALRYNEMREADKNIDRDTEDQPIIYQRSTGNEEKTDGSISNKLVEILQKILEQLLAPPTVGSFAGLFVGAIPWTKNLLVGDNAPLRVIQDSMTLLGDGTIPCLTLILGANLTQGLRKASIKPMIIIAIIIIRYLILPMIGIGVIKTAAHLKLLPVDPLFSFVLVIMFALPPGVNISTMTQLFDVGQEECAVIMMWTYLASAFALTGWSMVFMWILS